MQKLIKPKKEKKRKGKWWYGASMRVASRKESIN